MDYIYIVRRNLVLKVIWLSHHPEMDSYCKSIFMCFFIEPSRRFGFNELHRRVQTLGKMSMPTLSDHLDHLIDLKLILKETDRKSSGPLKKRRYYFNMKLDKHLSEDERAFDLRILDKKLGPLLKEYDFKDIAQMLFGQITLINAQQMRHFIRAQGIKDKYERQAIFLIGKTLLSLSLSHFLTRFFQLLDAVNEKEREIMQKEFEVAIEHIEEVLKSTFGFFVAIDLEDDKKKGI